MGASAGESDQPRPRAGTRNRTAVAAERLGVLGPVLAVLVLVAGVASLAGSVRVSAESVWSPVLQEAGGGAVLFVALQFFIARRLGRRVIVGLVLLAAAALAGAAWAPPGTVRDLLVIGGVGVVLFLALDLLLVRFLVVRAMRAEVELKKVLMTLRELRDFDGEAFLLGLQAAAADQRERELAELLDEYGGDNPFNMFAGLGAAEDREWQQAWIDGQEGPSES